MSLNWKNPPRDYRTECEEIAAELHTRPGDWAQVLEDSPDIDAYVEELRLRGIETRLHNDREEGTGHPKYLVWTRGDLYARAPKETTR